jgi:hypothetical protein
MGKSFFLAIFNSYVYVKLLEGIDGGILYNIYIYHMFIYLFNHICICRYMYIEYVTLNIIYICYIDIMVVVPA